VSREKAHKLRKSHRIWTQLYNLWRIGRPHDAEAHDLDALKVLYGFHDADGRSWPFANELIHGDYTHVATCSSSSATVVSSCKSQVRSEVVS
jgi:hypothetical protein